MQTNNGSSETNTYIGTNSPTNIRGRKSNHIHPITLWVSGNTKL